MVVNSSDNMFGGTTKRPPSSRRATRISDASLSQPLSKILPLKRKSLLFGPAAVVNLPVKVSASSASSLLLTSSSLSSLPMPLSLSFSTTSRSVESLQAALRTGAGTTTGPSTEQSTTINLLAGSTNVLQQRHRRQQQQCHNHQYHHHHHTPQWRFRLLPGLKATSFFTILTLVCLETVLLSTVSNCAQTFYMHWNTSNSIFRIDNTDHIIDVNKGNPAFEFDQVHIICPVYEPGTFENETEKYIIYNVSKVEYETCRITNADPRVIAICDKPQKLMFFTITFRPFTPQPGGLEFLPGNDYYFISTSSKDDLYRRIGGRCSTNNMKVVFKVCCTPEDKNNRTSNNIGGGGAGGGGGGIGNTGGNDNIGSRSGSSSNSNTAIQQQHNNNNINGGLTNGGISQLPSPKMPGMSGGMSGINSGGGLMMNGNSGTSINTNIDQFNRIPMQQPNNIGGHGSMGGMGVIGGGGGSISGHQTGIRINNVPSSQQHPSQKNGMHGGFISPMANINTNSSNVVQSTISWPDWGNHNNYNGDRNRGGSEGGSGDTLPGSITVQQHSTPVSTIGIHPHFYPSHITSTRPNINRAVNNNSNYSPSHKPTKKTNDYDKHPNEVVKNEELTYNSAASSLSFYKIARRRTILALRKTTHQINNMSTYEKIFQRFKSLLQISNHRNRINAINTLINFVSNCNPIIITTTVLVTLINLFHYKLTWSMRRCIPSSSPTPTSLKVNRKAVTKSQLQEHRHMQMPMAITVTSPTMRASMLYNVLRPSSQTLPPLPIQPPLLSPSPLDCIETAVALSSNTLNITSPIR